eukprot:TRINITY_DN51549_c0_g1_i1.p2 TRINITY_DN51549_c0_g1~~TRINITY_DN51549_c0_g1_i1.p2  ORF type:complete len:236 (+),score=72.08 TRINITY_DN51549_c0_g1_i1:160-867(+)
MCIRDRVNTFNENHKDLKRKRIWESHFDKQTSAKQQERLGGKKADKKIAYLTASSTFTLTPPTWELQRDSTQMIAHEERKVCETYIGRIIGMESQDDRNVYHMCTESITCSVKDKEDDEELFEFNVEYNTEDPAKPVKKHVYRVPGNGYLQVGANELSWHLNDDNEEIWVESRSGEMQKLMCLSVHPLASAASTTSDGSDDEGTPLEVMFVPDDAQQWYSMTQTVSCLMKKPKEK